MQLRLPHSHHAPTTVWPASATKGIGELVSGSVDDAKKTGIAKMHTTASRTLVFITDSSLELVERLKGHSCCPRLYQEIAEEFSNLIHNRVSLAALSNRLTKIADNAHCARRFDIVSDIGDLLLKLAESKHSECVARFYRALAINKGTLGDRTFAGGILEQISECAPARYRARVMLALGGNSFAASDYRIAATWYKETMKLLTRERLFDPTTLYFASRMMAVIKSLYGDHRGAVGDLEQMLPLVRMAGLQLPYAYYDYSNTRAVELTEVGRLEDARRAADFALSSKYATAYPEWSETSNAIAQRARRASRNTVAIGRKRTKIKNLYSIPISHMPAGTIQENESGNSARIIKFPSMKITSQGMAKTKSDALGTEERYRIMLERLYGMFLSAIRKNPLDSELVEKLYGVFAERGKGG